MTDAKAGTPEEEGFLRREKRAKGLFLLGLLCVLIASAYICMLVGDLGPIGPGVSPEGSQDRWYISFEDAFRAIFLREGNSGDVGIFWDLRIPRVLLAAVVGAALASAGTAMQAVFRNPMADPFIIGVSSGAAVGGVSAELLGLTAVIGAFTAPMSAFFMSLATVFLVYRLGTVRGRVYVDTLLLSGVAVAAFLGAVVSFMIYRAGEHYRMLLPWLLGSLHGTTWTELEIIAVPVIVGALVIFLYARDLNALLLGEETAHNLGANPEFLKKLMLVVAALVTAAAVAFVGIVGFVGLIVPHMMRAIVGAHHRALVPASAMFGACLVIWADTLARTIISGEELPIGIITALCGGPFFLYLLRRSRTGGGMI